MSCQAIYAKWKKPVWKGYILHDSRYMTFQKNLNYRDIKMIIDY